LVELSDFKDQALAFTRRSMQAYLDLKTGKYQEAAGETLAGLADIDRTASDMALPRAMLHYVAAMANLKIGSPSASIPHAEAVRTDNSLTAHGLRAHLRRHATRLYVQASYQLKQYERISRLLTDDPEASVDPFVLNALAVASYTEGDAKSATALLMRAIDALPPAGEDELRQTIVANRKLLNV
jgi:tetratricopeptide (TPR) repeat protein